MSDCTAIQELLTCNIKLKTFEWNKLWLNHYCGTLFAKIIVNVDIKGTISRFSGLTIHNKKFSASKTSSSPLNYL